MSIESDIDAIIETNGKKYRFSARYLQTDSFVLQVISEDFTTRYGGEFSSSYIEDITKKSGGMKRLPVFWRMICLACNNLSSSIKIEVFHSSFLQQLTTMVTENSDKLYVIITQISDFDKIRYPLPLAVAPFTCDELTSTVRKLYNQNVKLQDMLDEIDASRSIQSLEQRMSMLSANYEDLQFQKDNEIDKLKKKLSVLKEQKAQTVAANKMERKRSQNLWDRLNQKSSPRKLHQEEPSMNRRPPPSRSKSETRKQRTSK